jgi:predicted HTH transcriptional regulator
VQYKFLPQKLNDTTLEKDEFMTLIRAGESETLDFKQTITAQKIARTLVAFANAKGGTILVGVSDKKNLLGIDVAEESYVIEEAANKYCLPPVEIVLQEYEEDNKSILVVQVKESPNKNHQAQDTHGKWHLYIRMGDKNIALSKIS